MDELARHVDGAAGGEQSRDLGHVPGAAGGGLSPRDAIGGRPRVRARVEEPRRPLGRWAPWWAYLVPILVLNSLRQVLVPPAEVGDGVSVAVAVATAAAVAVVVTALRRSLHST